MSDDLSRRAGLAGLAALPMILTNRDLTAGEPPKPETVEWDVVPCPGCQRDVCFELDQRVNRCGWCGTTVRRLAA